MAWNVRRMAVRHLKLRLASNSSSQEQLLKKTPLYDFHIANGAKMVPFCSWLMPVQYNDMGIVQSHLHTRTSCSLFDVSHMLQFLLRGKDRLKCLQQLVVSDLQEMTTNTSRLTLFTNTNGGILDDAIVTKLDEGMYVVSNAGRADFIRPYVQDHVNRCASSSLDVSVHFIQDRTLLALQGPRSASILQCGTKTDLSKVYFMNSAKLELFGVSDISVSRTGYTGEDGFEISVPSAHSSRFVSEMLSVEPGTVKPAGLGARDTLRLEAGMCLYGNDIDETTTPIEASLRWTLGKQALEGRCFPGADIIAKQIKDGVSQRRVGLSVQSGRVPRAGAEVFTSDGKQLVGKVTSGNVSPVLQKSIAICYVSQGMSAVGTALSVKVGSSHLSAEVVKMPFVPTQYYIERK